MTNLNIRLKEYAIPWWACLVALGLSLALLSGCYTGWYNDDANYLCLARSICQGTYTDLYKPEPVFHRRYPPLFPLMLAPFQWLAPERIELARIPALICGALLPWATWRWLRAESSRVRTVTTWGVALNPLILCYSGLVLSDIPFLFALIWFLGGSSKPIRPWVWAFGSAVLLYLRAAAIALFPACVLSLFFQHKQRKGAVLYAILTVVLALPYLAQQSYSQDLHTLPPGLVQFNLNFYFFTLPSTLWGNAECFPPIHGLPSAGLIVASVVTWAVLIRGVARRGFNLESLFFLLFLGQLSVWPYQEPRFLIPVIPIGVVLLVEGLPRAGKLGKVLIPLLALVQMAFLVRTWQISHQPNLRNQAPEGYWRWLAGQPAGPILDVHIMTWVKTGRRVILAPPAGTEPEMALVMALRSRAQYITIYLPQGRSQSLAPLSEPLWRAIHLAPELFQLELEDPQDALLVFRRLPGGENWLAAADHYEAGVQAAQQGRVQDALDQFALALRKAPAFRQARLNRVILLRLLGREAEARVEERQK
ncbi:MAG: hypothetical protein KF760_25580 [Candidatus Eremiobacteraeota bacterium]|nr:hypothetical protein [Candidatus Eremiobacteraeota bacterium]MCW5866849.1 hypothetical protein [Candidatus Eremiobacteraeota bacterium]